MERKCIFDPSKSCPAKKAFKLQPESLVEFCKVCTFAPVNVSQQKQMLEVFMQITMTMGNLQRDLGKQTALAEVYEKLYEEAKDPLKTSLKKLEKLRRIKEMAEEEKTSERPAS